MANHKHKNMGNDRCECGVAVLTAKEVHIYGLKAIKMAGGDETPRFEAKITENGKVIGTVYNEGCGGSCGYLMDNLHDNSQFEAFIKQWGIDNKQDFEVADMWVYDELDKYDERKMLLRRSKTATPFRVKGDPKDEWRLWKHPYCEGVKKAIETKYGDSVETIFVGR